MTTLPVIEKLLDYHVAQVSQLYWPQVEFYVNIISPLHISCWPRCMMQKRMPAKCISSLNALFQHLQVIWYSRYQKVAFNIKLSRLEISFMDWDRTVFFKSLNDNCLSFYIVLRHLLWSCSFIFVLFFFLTVSHQN